MQCEEDERIKKTLSKQHPCYVLITCNTPMKNGLMNVEMSYEGDVALAALMIDGAREIIQEHIEEEMTGSL